MSWIGTPFHAHATVKGEGCSCQSLAAEIYRELGHPVPDLPKLSLRHFRVNRTSAIAPFMDGLSNFMRTGVLHTFPSLVESGDFLHFEFDDCEHCGVALNQTTFIHAHIKRGVTLASLRDAFYKQALKRTWRPI